MIAMNIVPNTMRSLVIICLLLSAYESIAIAQQSSNSILDSLLDEIESVHSGEFEAKCRIKRSVESGLREETQLIHCWFAPKKLRWEARSEEGFVVGLGVASKFFVAVNDSDALLVDRKTFDQHLNKFDYRCLGFDLPIGLRSRRDASQLIAKYKTYDLQLLESEADNRVTLAVDVPHGVFSIAVDTEKRIALGMDYTGELSRHSSKVEWQKKSGSFVPLKAYLETDSGHLSGTINFDWKSVNEKLPAEVFSVASAFSTSDWVIEETDGGNKVVDLDIADEKFFGRTVKPQSLGVLVGFLIASVCLVLMLLFRYRTWVRSL